MTAESSFAVSPEVRVALDAYLDAVDLSLLKAAVSRAHRAAIVRDLEVQLLDMLRERCAGRPATPEDVRAILATMDPPDAYAQGRATFTPAAPAAARPRRRVPSHALWGIGMLAFGLFSLLVLFGVSSHGRHRGGDDFGAFVLLVLAGTPVVLMIAMASLLGLSAWRQIAADRARYWGRPIALVEMAALPFLLLCAAPGVFLAMLLVAGCLAVVHHLFDLRATARRLLAPF